MTMAKTQRIITFRFLTDFNLDGEITYLNMVAPYSITNLLKLAENPYVRSLSINNGYFTADGNARVIG